MVNSVVDIVNQVVQVHNDRMTPGYELPLLLFSGFRTLIDRLHEELARQGHPEVRPAYGFALQAIGADGATASELGRRLGVSKQAAGKTVDRLSRLGYVERAASVADARAKVVRLTPRGLDLLTRSAEIFDELRAEWVRELGEEGVAGIEAGLRTVTPSGTRVDAVAWFGAWA
ncbi:MarR family winged helix-turn-helix transcriptional regulator [Amycolatopsis magusensis]|uniref:MarR family winged helix-turn-helix transcriptional regulator n=1 Tax=Amycolatopsis magusensis TaxID=882444 RepID=UPI0024A9C16F|nr:MarR family winged helix-turn-helix transcriptional regulator [Amycolatopsis magusensis]MDI5977930.1 MarR family winged helix-turn-helix transcriptional regulator [Amycolatopsis magusensis]